MKDANYKAYISFELSLLLADQSEYFEKTALSEPTPRNFNYSRITATESENCLLN